MSLKYIAFLAFAALCCHRLVHKYRNAVLLALSYLFYACFDIRFLPYIALTTAATYAFAIFMERRPPRGRKLALALAVIFNIGILFIFKYLGFALGLLPCGCLRAGIAPPRAGLILPLGLSFYIFQLTGYVIDVYRGDIVAERTRGFCAVCLLFPGLVSGPIQRAPKMLPQYKRQRLGLRKRKNRPAFSCGYVQKMVIADRSLLWLTPLTATLRSSPAFNCLPHPLPIPYRYCDFSAYSQMAIGSAKIFDLNCRKTLMAPTLPSRLRISGGAGTFRSHPG